MTETKKKKKSTPQEIYLYISLQQVERAKEALTVANCLHNFEKYGRGYRCRSCDYITGVNKTINDMINSIKFYSK